MSSTSSAIRVFRGFGALLAPAKSSSSSSYAAASKAKPKAKTKTKTKTTGNAAPQKSRSASESGRLTGITKANPLSPELREFLGMPEASRSDAVKQIWSYVKLHDLQNPADKKEIYCDEKLKSIFEGKEKVGFLEISRLLSRHFLKN